MNVNISTVFNQAKEYLGYVLIIVVSFIALFWFIPPQIQRLFFLGEEKTKIKQHVKTLSSNLEILSLFSEHTLDSQLRLTVKALPDTKDFNGIITGISQAALAAGVRVGDFGFDVGDIEPKYSDIGTLSFLSMSLSIDGGLNGLKRFLTELEKKFPLSEIKDIQTSGTTSRISTIFYFKPFPQVKLNKNVIVSSITKEESTLIEKLFQYENSLSSKTEVSFGTQSALPSSTSSQ